MAQPPLLETLQLCQRAHRAVLASRLAPHGLHAGQDALLLAIWAQPGLRQVALAERLEVEPPTVSRMIERLERGGLVRRERDPHDARLWRVHPTTRSRLLEASVRRIHADLDAAMESALGSGGRDQLRRLLGVATTALQAMEAVA
jgi:DNA-binding MarR family transcriptional regulator